MFTSFLNNCKPSEIKKQRWGIRKTNLDMENTL